MSCMFDDPENSQSPKRTENSTFISHYFTFNGQDYGEIHCTYDHDAGIKEIEPVFYVILYPKPKHFSEHFQREDKDEDNVTDGQCLCLGLALIESVES